MARGLFLLQGTFAEQASLQPSNQADGHTANVISRLVVEVSRTGGSLRGEIGRNRYA